MERKTKIINIVAGAGVGKSVLASQIFHQMKIDGCSIEFVGEYAKELVYEKNFELLNNQHYVSYKQKEMLKALVGKVDYIVTDGSILHGLVYNILHKDNISNIEKTEKKILEFYNEFDNITFFLQRNKNYDYENNGRIQTFDEAIKIDSILEDMLKKHKITYKSFFNSKENFTKIMNYIKSYE